MYFLVGPSRARRMEFITTWSFSRQYCTSGSMLYAFIELGNPRTVITVYLLSRVCMRLSWHDRQVCSRKLVGPRAYMLSVGRLCNPLLRACLHLLHLLALITFHARQCPLSKMYLLRKVQETFAEDLHPSLTSTCSRRGLVWIRFLFHRLLLSLTKVS